MSFVRVIVAGLLATSALLAADSFLGAWKLDAAHSEFAQGPKAQTGTLIYERKGAGYVVQSQLVYADKPASVLTGRILFDGNPAQSLLDGRTVSVVSKKADGGAHQLVITNSEKPAGSVQFAVSSQDHKLRADWMDATGKPVAKLVYDSVPGEKLEIGKPMGHEFSAGDVAEYLVTLREGEYCEGKIEQKGGAVSMLAYNPDGSRVRGYPGPPTGTRTFGLVAPTTGTYAIVLYGPSKDSATSYEIRIEKVLGVDARMAIPSDAPKLTSPRMEALKKDVAAGKQGAVAAFWDEVAAKGTPLAEPIEGNDKDLAVTFLWRAKGETRNVFVMWFPWSIARPDDYKMVRLGDTDVWYRTVKIRRGARFAYQLSPNDPLRFDDTSGRLRAATAQADPLNPHHWFENPGGSPLEYQSMAELPGAVPQPYITKRPDVPAGNVERNTITSALLKNTRDLSIYTPPGYRRDGKPYGLLMVFDESAYLGNVPTPVILDNLLAEQKIPPMVAVLIANPSQDARNRELPPNPDFADFLNNELVAWVRENYNVTRDPRQVVVAGSSYGGIASTYAALRHPETFGNVLCQSGSFWWSAQKPEPYAEPNYLVKEFLKSPKLPIRFYMDAGSFEVDTSGGGGAILEPSRHMRDVLLAKGYEVHFQEFIGGHDYLSWRGTLADGLIALVGSGEGTR